MTATSLSRTCTCNGCRDKACARERNGLGAGGGCGSCGGHFGVRRADLNTAAALAGLKCKWNAGASEAPSHTSALTAPDHGRASPGSGACIAPGIDRTALGIKPVQAACSAAHASSPTSRAMEPLGSTTAEISAVSALGGAAPNRVKASCSAGLGDAALIHAAPDVPGKATHAATPDMFRLPAPGVSGVSQAGWHATFASGTPQSEHQG